MFIVQNHSGKKVPYVLLALIILLTCTAQVYLFKQPFYPISADENARTYEAASKTFSQLLRPSSWLPLHIIINKLGLSLYYDLFLTPRILTSIVGIITSMALMFLAYRLFGNSTISIITGILAIYYPHRLIFSIAPMSEIYFMCFMTLGCAFVLGWITNERKDDLLFSTFCFLLCSTLRYEGWLVSATMASILTIQRFVTRKLDWRPYLINITLLTSFPLYWLFAAYLTKSMGEISGVSKYYIHVFGKDPMGVWTRSFLYQVIDQSVYRPLIAGLISFICYVVQDKKVRILSLIILIPMLGMTIQGFMTYSLPAHNWWRLAGPTLILFLPFLAHLIYTACSAISVNRHVYYVSLVIVTSLFVVAFYTEVTRMTKISSFFTRDHLRVGIFLKTLCLKGNDKILLDTSTWSYSNLMIASNMPANKYIFNTGGYPTVPKTGVVDFNKGIDVIPLKKMGIKYFVFQTKGRPDMDTTLNANISDQSRILNTSKALRKINQIGEWGIFALQ